MGEEPELLSAAGSAFVDLELWRCFSFLLFAADLHFLFPLGLRSKASLLRGRKAEQAFRGNLYTSGLKLT